MKIYTYYNIKFKLNCFYSKIFILLALSIINILLIGIGKKYYRKRIAVIGLNNDNNIGNNLVKFSMYTLLKEYKFKPLMISPINKKKNNIYFLKNHIKYKEIKKTFSELKEKYFDIIMVNSDQTWNKFEHYYDVGFLKFAENWTIPKFVYGASLGSNKWKFSGKFDVYARKLIKNFTGISVREISSVKLVQKHLGIKPLFVLDPTMLIEKKHYLNLIKNFKSNFNFSDKYLCVYQLDKNNIINNFINEISEKYNYKIYRINLSEPYYIENFLFAINISKAVITDSFHGTVFSIIFNKSFISFINNKRGKARFTSLKLVFKLKGRIIDLNSKNKININLLSKPLNLNKSKLYYLKKISIKYLKKNLFIK